MAIVSVQQHVTALQGRHFWSTWHTLEYIFGFLLITSWLTPMLLVLSLAANENTLPGGGVGMPSTSSRAGRCRRQLAILSHT